MAIPAPLPADEAHRLEALRGLGLLDTPSEEGFDRITRMLARVVGVPIALVNLVDADRQWGKSCFGLTTSEAPRSASFCAHVILGDSSLVVPDTLLDERFADNAQVQGPPHLRSYAGHPVHDASGFRIGALCMADRRPRQWTEAELAHLSDLAAWVELEIRAGEIGEAAARVAHSEARVRAIVDSVAEGVLTTDSDGHVTFANRAACVMLRRDPAELLNLTLREALHADAEDPCPLCDKHGDRGSDADGHLTHEDDFVRADGSVLPVEVTVVRVRYDGHTTGSVVVFRDATERRELQRMKDSFVASVSHGLRTPLTSIKGYLEALLDAEDGPINDEQRQDLQIVYRNAARLRALIDDLLFVSRVDAGALKLRTEPLEVAALLADLAREMAPVAEAREVALRFDANGGATVMGDAQRLHQTFANLVANAIKFSPPKATVELRAGVDDRDAVVEVVDQGPGIPADELPRLGERFFRASTAGAVEGTGLGLTISREIVEHHGGRMEVESHVGRGSVFRVRLPLEDAGRA